MGPPTILSDAEEACLTSDHLERIYKFTDLMFSLQNSYNSKLNNFEFLACFSSVNIIYNCYEVSFYMPHKI